VAAVKRHPPQRGTVNHPSIVSFSKWQKAYEELLGKEKPAGYPQAPP
jgi:hypothetical protein